MSTERETRHPGADRPSRPVSTRGTVDAGSVDIVRELWSAASGAQSVDLNGNCCDPGAIMQSLTTTPGLTYSLTFSFAGNPDPNPICASSPVIKQMEVFWGGTSLGVFTFDTTGHTLADPGWQAISLPVTASSGVTTLRFASHVREDDCNKPPR